MESTTSRVILCKYCGDNTSENFLEGRYTTCKKCLNELKRNSKQKIKAETVEPKNNKEVFESFIMNSATIFNGTLYQVITEMQKEITEIKKENSIIKEKYLDLQNEYSKINKGFSFLYNEYLKYAK